MKNWKLGTKITLGITIIVIICMSLLYLTANKTMTGMMQESELNVMKNTLNAQASLLNEYVARQEAILTAYSKTPCVRDFLKDVNNSEQQAIVQSYTEDYYSGLNNWEGIYIGEWNTHIVAHSNSKVIGMTTREGDSLKALQDAMTQRNGLYDAGIIVSPSSGELILSMYCPVFDTDGKTILGYVGGGPFVKELEKQLQGEIKNFIAGGRAVNNSFKSVAGQQLQKGDNTVMHICQKNDRNLDSIEEKYISSSKSDTEDKTGT